MEENKQLQFEEDTSAYQEETSLLTPTNRVAHQSTHFHKDEKAHEGHDHHSEEEEDPELVDKLIRLRDEKSIVFNYYRMSKMLGAGKSPSKILVLGGSPLTCSLVGTFGEVWNCVQRETGAHRAVKVIKIKKDGKEPQQIGKEPKKKKDTGVVIQEQISGSTDPLNEIKLMCKVDHPNIVRVHETFRDKEHYYIVLE